jgi:RNA-directed DNA polymerase
MRQAARHRTKETFTALFHHINPDALKRDAAPGVDGMTWRTYEADFDRRIADLCELVPKVDPSRAKRNALD